jgi:hypothetical protein
VGLRPSVLFSSSLLLFFLLFMLSCNILQLSSLSSHTEEDLPQLWQVFSKVKTTLSDGNRLENMSWRLWSRAESNSNKNIKLTLPECFPPCSRKQNTIIINNNLTTKPITLINKNINKNELNLNVKADNETHSQQRKQQIDKITNFSTETKRHVIQDNEVSPTASIERKNWEFEKISKEPHTPEVSPTASTERTRATQISKEPPTPEVSPTTASTERTRATLENCIVSTTASTERTRATLENCIVSTTASTERTRATQISKEPPTPEVSPTTASTERTRATLENCIVSTTASTERTRTNLETRIVSTTASTERTRTNCINFDQISKVKVSTTASTERTRTNLETRTRINLDQISPNPSQKLAHFYVHSSSTSSPSDSCSDLYHSSDSEDEYQSFQPTIFYKINDNLFKCERRSLLSVGIRNTELKIGRNKSFESNICKVNNGNDNVLRSKSSNDFGKSDKLFLNDKIVCGKDDDDDDVVVGKIGSSFAGLW